MLPSSSVPSSDLEYAVLISCLDLAGRLLGVAAESERSSNGLQNAFGAKESAIGILVLALFAMLALDGQQAVLHAHVQILFVEAGCCRERAGDPGKDAMNGRVSVQSMTSRSISRVTAASHACLFEH